MIKDLSITLTVTTVKLWATDYWPQKLTVVAADRWHCLPGTFGIVPFAVFIGCAGKTTRIWFILFSLKLTNFHYPGNSRVNRREPASCLGQVFNLKLGRFALMKILHDLCITKSRIDRTAIGPGLALTKLFTNNI